MPKQASSTPREVGIRLSTPELWHLHLERKDGGVSTAGDINVSLQFGIGVNRISENTVVVQLSVEVEDVPGLEIQAAYRVTATLDTKGLTGIDLEQHLKPVAMQVVPSALYPFLRETIASAALKAGITNLVLPIVNFRKVFQPDNLQIPPPPKKAAHSVKKSEAQSVKPPDQ